MGKGFVWVSRAEIGSSSLPIPVEGSRARVSLRVSWLPYSP